ncbi:MFS transporter [Streptomyces sulfonofaciens]|uniref:MFS transporter n=1 Tax=Streptomyces sulfonofaciens TaxID=68272 RepID=A0A919GJP4_9ACTN|nr:MFS transporter [Streptomyces sulfonofaciens]
MTEPGPDPGPGPSPVPAEAGSGYKWVALSNTTLGVLIATINQSIMLIALPDIFRGIGVDPLEPGNTSLLLWLIMSYLVVTAVLVVSFGRLGDIYGRTRMYNLGFAVFTVFSVLLSVTWLKGTDGALWLIAMRVLQGVGGAMLMANSSAILTDAFPARQRGLALGLNQVAGIAGSFVGLVIGGLLGPVDWRLVFLVSVPFGVFGTVWAYLRLRDTGVRTPATLDWWGNITFALGLIALLTGITYGIQPYAGHSMGWTNPWVIATMAAGVLVLAVFCVIETKAASPMFHLSLFRIRAFTAGNCAGLLASLGRGGLMFILIIWLQGIWLPRHGYGFAQTPLWAGIYMLPLTLGFLVAGPVSGWASDRFGARTFATGGMVLAAATFVALEALPVDFAYVWFALILLLNGIGMGLFAAPNRAAIMNSLPPDQRGVGAGISTTFQNSAMVLSIGIFFSLMITGLAGSLPHALTTGLTAQGVPAADAGKIAALPPVGVLFASLLGYNPIRTLLGPHVLNQLPAGHASYLTGREFFPRLISGPFADGLSVAFAFACCLIAACASLLRGGKYYHGDRRSRTSEPDGDAGTAPGTASPGASAGTARPDADAPRSPAPRSTTSRPGSP